MITPDHNDSLAALLEPSSSLCGCRARRRNIESQFNSILKRFHPAFHAKYFPAPSHTYRPIRTETALHPTRHHLLTTSALPCRARALTSAAYSASAHLRPWQHHLCSCLTAVTSHLRPPHVPYRAVYPASATSALRFPLKPSNRNCCLTAAVNVSARFDHGEFPDIWQHGATPSDISCGAGMSGHLAAFSGPPAKK